MSIVVEDGTGLASANSYVDVAFADEYFESRGNAAWAEATTEAKEKALINATDYIDLRWGSRLIGRPDTSAQALEFPRTGLHITVRYEADGIPTNWKRAVCEYAVEALTSDLNQTVNRSESAAIARRRVVIGPITTETSYHEGSQAAAQVAYPKADNYAKQFIVVSKSVMRN